jgi:leucyl aminopeptidase (aminopeptidase T)
MTRPGMTRIYLLIAVSLAMLGCNNAKYKSTRYERDRRMYGMATDYVAYNKAGPERMSYVAGVDRKVRQRQQESLDRTLKFIEDSSEREQARWDAQHKNRQSWFQRIFKGKPEQIEDTFAKMTY